MAYQTHAPWGTAPGSYVRDEGLLLIAEGLSASGKGPGDEGQARQRLYSCELASNVRSIPIPPRADALSNLTYLATSTQRPISESDRHTETASENAVDEDEIEDTGPSHISLRQSFAQSWQSPAANSAAVYSKVASMTPASHQQDPSHLDVAPPQPSASEHTPLLLQESVSKEQSHSDNPRQAVWEELSLLLKWSAPICVTHLLELSLVTVTVISVGHLGTLELAAASLASMTCNVVSLSFIQGAASALDTVRLQVLFATHAALTDKHAYSSALKLTPAPGRPSQACMLYAP